MGFLDFLGPQESPAEIDSRIRSSEAGKLFAQEFIAMLNPGDDHYQWLMAGNHRMYELKTFQNGVQLIKVEVTQERLKATGSYHVDEEGWGFGASGYQDLPNRKYVDVFQRFLLEQISENCPNVIVDENYIKLRPTAKKGW